MATQSVTLPRRVLDDSRTAGFIDAGGVDDLIRVGFISEAIYPMAKAYDDDPRAQEHFFRRLVPILWEGDPYALAAFLHAEAERIGVADTEVRRRNLARAINGSLTREPLSVRVRVAQLIQWNRLGRDEWRERMKGAAWVCQRKNIEPVLVAYAILAMLPEIIKRVGCCYILNPGWISNPDNPYCGLHLSAIYVSAVLIGKDEELTVEPYILDDTISTGKTLNDLRRYLAWRGNPLVTPHMLWDARSTKARALFPVDGSTSLEWTEQEVI